MHSCATHYSTLRLKDLKFEAGEMAQWVREFATKPDCLSSIPGTNMEKEGIDLDIHMCTELCAYAPYMKLKHKTTKPLKFRNMPPSIMLATTVMNDTQVHMKLIY